MKLLNYKLIKMSKSEFKINVDKISADLKEVIPNFKKSELGSYCGVTEPTIHNWKKEAPVVVELIYYNCKTFNHSFLEMIDRKSDLFPVFKLLKFYSEKTGQKIESVIDKM